MLGGIPKVANATGAKMSTDKPSAERAEVKKSVCRKIQGVAEEGNSCLQTPGTCESCPLWSAKTVTVVKARMARCDSCGKNKTKRKGTFAAPIVLVLGKEFFSLCMNCAKKTSSLLDAAIESIEAGYRRKK